MLTAEKSGLDLYVLDNLPFSHKVTLRVFPFSFCFERKLSFDWY